MSGLTKEQYDTIVTQVEGMVDSYGGYVCDGEDAPFYSPKHFGGYGRLEFRVGDYVIDLTFTSESVDIGCFHKYRKLSRQCHTVNGPFDFFTVSYIDLIARNAERFVSNH